MELQQLEIFTSVVKHLSLTKAARELSVSQPRISQQLKALQTQYGVLFQKSGRGVTLTTRGHEFYKDVDSLLSQHANLKTKYGPLLPSNGGDRLTVGGSQCPSAALLPRAISQFQVENDSAHVTLRSGSDADLQRSLLESIIDVAVLMYPTPTPSVTIIPYVQFRQVPFVHAKHPLTKKRQPILPEDLSRFPLVLDSATVETLQTSPILNGLQKKGISIHQVIRCDCPEAIKHFIRHGNAVGILYEDFIAQGLRHNVFRTLAIHYFEFFTNSYIVYPTARPLTKHAATFLGILADLAMATGPNYKEL